MNIFDAMSDRTVLLLGGAFTLALQRRSFAQGIFEKGILTATEIRRFSIKDKPVQMRRRLNKIVISVEEYDKLHATDDIIDAVQERIDFIGHIAEEQT